MEWNYISRSLRIPLQYLVIKLTNQSQRDIIATMVSEEHHSNHLRVFHFCFFTGPKDEITAFARKNHNEPLFMALYGQRRIKCDPVSTNQDQSVSQPHILNYPLPLNSF